MTDRTIARIIGILFILASAAAIVGGTLVVPVEDADTLAEVATHDTGIVTGVLVELVMVWSVLGIAAMFFPVLRRRNEGVALGYLGARMVEAVLLLVAAMIPLVVLGLSRDPAVTGATVGDPTGSLQSLVAVREWTYTVGSLVALGIGALLLYGLLYRSRIVPRWLSAWGLAGAVLILLRGVIEIYGAGLSGAIQGLLAAPIGINEMVLAVWLIIRGFEPPVTVVLPEARRTTVGA